jgi:hypothetical protein
LGWVGGAQASAINSTLSVLRRVVEARSKRKGEDEKEVVVPYKESKLTRVRRGLCYSLLSEGHTRLQAVLLVRKLL